MPSATRLTQCTASNQGSVAGTCGAHRPAPLQHAHRVHQSVHAATAARAHTRVAANTCTRTVWHARRTATCTTVCARGHRHGRHRRGQETTRTKEKARPPRGRQHASGTVKLHVCILHAYPPPITTAQGVSANRQSVLHHHGHRLAHCRTRYTCVHTRSLSSHMPTAVVRVRPALAGEGRYFVRVPEGTNRWRADMEELDDYEEDEWVEKRMHSACCNIVITCFHHAQSSTWTGTRKRRKWTSL